MDWRAHPPTIPNIGPVLHPDDAVANKVTALFSRAQARDHIDVNGALTSGRYSRDDLVKLAEEHDPGFDRRMFAQALTAIERLPDSEFTVYGLDIDVISALRVRLPLTGRRGTWPDGQCRSSVSRSPSVAG
jgi:hypothetical protein